MRFKVREFLSEPGQSPFRHWLDQLDPAVRARVQARVLRFEVGNLGDHKSVGRGVWEARLPFGPGYRLYFGKDGPSLILLLLGGSKSTQRGDIARAQQYWAAYSNRHDMTRRSRDWNKGLAEDLQNPIFAREFLLAAVEDGVPVQVALAKVIRATGVRQFAAKVKMADSNVLRAINPRHNPTTETLNRLLRPFRLRLDLQLVDAPSGRSAA